MYFIDDISIGYKNEHSVIITEDLHNKFASISEDNSPIHQDAEFCKNSAFKKPIGYAFLITTILSKIYGTIFPGGSELCLKQTCNFKSPFFIGDTLKFNMEVIQKNNMMKIITIKTKVTNQEQITIFTGEAILQLSLGKK